jgi:hypothetical protein
MAHGAHQTAQTELGMTKPKYTPPAGLPASDLPEVRELLARVRASQELSVRPNVPILDADFDDLVPGYSDSDDWYEP